MDSNFSSTPSSGVHPLPFGKAEVFISAILLISLCIFGVVANVISIATILYSKKLKSPFFYLILSLCVSDLLSAIVSPIALNRLTWGYDVWQWPDILCKLFWAIDIWTSYVTSVHILLFAALRFLSVQWPFRYRYFTGTRAKICIAVAWTVTFGCGFFPTVLWYGGIHRDRSLHVLQLPSCSLFTARIPDIRRYREIAYPLLFYIPFCLIIIFSVALVCIVSRAATARRQLQGSVNSAKISKEKRKQTQRLIQLALIVGSFFFGYLPRTAYHFYSINRNTKPGHEAYEWWFAFIEFFLLRVSECLNPIFYNLSSSKMRKETIATLKAMWFNLKKMRKEEFTVTTNVGSSKTS